MNKAAVIFILFILFSCRSVKSASEKSTVSELTAITEITKDSTKVTKISEAIADDFAFSLRTNNKELDSIIKQRLKGFSTSKQSGNNSYSASFDYEKMALIVKGIVGPSIESETSTNSDAKSEKSFSQQTDEYFSKKIKSIPIWIYILVGLYFLPKIIAGITAILNPMQTLIGKAANLEKRKNNSSDVS